MNCSKLREGAPHVCIAGIFRGNFLCSSVRRDQDNKKKPSIAKNMWTSFFDLILLAIMRLGWM